MVPTVFYAVGCVLAAISVVVVYRSRVKVHVAGDTNSDDDDDDGNPEGQSSVRAAAETAALMKGEDDSLRSVHVGSVSLWSSILAFVQRSAVTKRPKAKSALMQRRKQGVKKIHKPYFYPLLDETAQWFAEWEHTKLHANQVEVVDVRIDKPKESAPAPSSPRDYLDGLDCISLAGFRANNHTVMPVAVV